jgi:predicted nucleic-acid-binding Zn-ribbon protein
MATVIEGAVLVYEGVGHIQYHHACENCGYVESHNLKNLRGSSGISSTMFHCPQCGNNQSVRIDLRG